MLLHRIGPWLDQRLVPTVAVLLLGADVTYSLNWLLTPPADLRSPAYTVAEQIAPMNAWGALLATLTALAVGCWAAGGRKWAVSYSVLSVGAMWAWWTVVFTLSSWGLADGASYFNSITAALVCILHLLVGVVIYYRPSVPYGGGR